MVTLKKGLIHFINRDVFIRADLMGLPVGLIPSAQMPYEIKVNQLNRSEVVLRKQT